MNILRVRTERAHRTGKPKDDSSRKIVAKFDNHKLKPSILSNISSSEGTYFFINDDYFKETVAIKKENWKNVKQLREQGKYAVLVYDKVV